MEGIDPTTEQLIEYILCVKIKRGCLAEEFPTAFKSNPIGIVIAIGIPVHRTTPEIVERKRGEHVS